ncbi:putative permease [Anatilimnocola aggregata]|uniref:Putative permease n=1 Tax=Anatilimnocola aggregata TaxID=2528021 RepID=A0A517YJ57_9BACT|nr:permease [Anatilimnocola aggregata]QDU30258.1 putative permease [Anatilimnocola aggregata]
MTEIFWGFILRFLQALTSAGPTILVGLIVAGVLEKLCGYEQTRRVFGGKGVKSLIIAWAWGMLLPVCSVGVIPILRVMRRSGLSGGTILAFALSAPIFNPISLLYGLTLSRPFVIVAFAACSLVVVTSVGLLWDWWFPDQQQLREPEATPAPGLKRMAAVGMTALRELTGPSLVFILIGLGCSALLAAILPHGSLQRSMNADNPWAPVTMLGVSIPIYATPMLAMSQLGSMFQHGNSTGASLVLLVFGTGLSVGTLAWITTNYGWARSAVWLALMSSSVLLLAYIVDKPLYPSDVEAADHTHAFDIYTSPFTGALVDPVDEMRMRLINSIQPYEWRVVYLLAGLLAVGLVLRRFNRAGAIDRWLQQQPETSGKSLDVAIPAPVLGGIAIVALIGFSIAGCYIYYPPPSVVFEELEQVRVGAIYAARHGEVRQAEHHIALWDEWSRKLEVGVYLRTFAVRDFQAMKGRILREKLELLRHEIEDGDRAAVDAMLREVQQSQSRWQQAFTPTTAAQRS